MSSAITEEFSCIGIVGVGLIGGSLGLAIKRFQPDLTVIGLDSDRTALERAQARGVIDSASQDLSDLRVADLIILATPIRVILDVLPKLQGVIKLDALVTDTGSTKAEICRAAQEHLPENFVGGHPLAGSEQQGIAGAHPFLFENALYVLTPLAKTEPQATRLAHFLQRLGAQPLLLKADSHDRLVAAVSHLPQLIAVAITKLVAQRSRESEFYRELAAGGFRDLTRIASSPFEMWQDILATNSAEIILTLDEFIGLLVQMRTGLTASEMETNFRTAKEFRDALPRRSKGFLRALHRLAVVMPDQPGALARVTSEIAKCGINIKDLELLKVREHEAGTFHFYFASEGDVELAATSLRKAGYECS